MKDTQLEEEEVNVGVVFIKEYNKLHGTDYDSQPDSVDTDADLIFRSGRGMILAVQITRAVTSEKEEAQITKDLKNSGVAWSAGKSPGQEDISRAIQKKHEKKYAGRNHTVLVIYTYNSAALPHGWKYGPNCTDPFKEIWYVDYPKRCAGILYP